MKRTEAEFRVQPEEQLRFDTLLYEISTRYINLPVDQIDLCIEEDQRRVCECLDIDLSVLWQWSEETPRFMSVTHLHSPPGGPSRPAEPIDAQESFPWGLEKMLNGETLAYSTEDMMEEAAVDQASRRHLGVKSSVNLPLSVGGGPLIGVLTFDTLKEERDWPEDVVKRLKLVAQVFCNALVRKESDRVLRQSEERLSLAAGSAGAGLWELNCDTNTFWATEKARAIFGYGVGESISMERFEQSVYPGDLERVHQVIFNSLDRRERFSIEYRIQTGDAGMKWIYSSGRPYFKSNGEPDRLLGVSFDITARKASESDSKRNEERLKSAIDIAALGFYEMGENNHSRFMDDLFRQILGIPPEAEESARQFWLEHIHKDDLEGILDVSRNVLENGVNRFALEYRYVHPKKGLTWLYHLSRVLARDSRGLATRVIGVVQDITEYKQKDIALKESMEHYRAMVEAYDGLIYICSQDYRVEYMNPRMIERTGRDAVNEFCYRALHNRDSVCPWCVNGEVFRGEIIRWEVQSPKDKRWYYVVNSPIKHTDGTVSKQSTILDITKRKLLEEQLRENAEVLKNNQKDLRKLAGRMISAKEEELRRLSRELHDDLTQRLAVLAIEAGKLEMNMNQKEQTISESIEKISQIKEQLINISDDVHRISRQLHPTILDDLGLVRTIEAECAKLMQMNDIEIIFTHENVHDRLPGDVPLCLYRIVQEGLRNFINHAGVKKCDVILEGSGDAISLTVLDEGAGFDPVEVRNKPGLGLSSMRERIHLVGGDLSIKSQLGRGTIIHVTLPLQRTET